MTKNRHLVPSGDNDYIEIEQFDGRLIVTHVRCDENREQRSVRPIEFEIWEWRVIAQKILDFTAEAP